MRIEIGAGQTNSQATTLSRVREPLSVSRNGREQDGHNATRGAQRTAAALGLLGVGLGVAGLVAPGSLVRVLGAGDVAGTRWVVRTLGLFGLVGGASMLTPEGVRALGFQKPGSDGHTHGVYVTVALTINVSRERVYAFWRDLTNLPRFMTHLESVELRDPHPHFKARLPAGIRLEWDAELTADRPNERIQWRSLPGADVENHGMVRFLPAPGNRGTEVHVMFSYEPPAGAVGAAFVKLFGKLPAQQIRADLRRLKQILETGDCVRSDASIHHGPHPAQPMTRREEARFEAARGVSP